jgi:hypothetical protein
MECSCLNLVICISVDGSRSWWTRQDVLREVTLLGRNGAALTALGDMDVVFLGAEEPFAARSDGVKLGESTLNRFLLHFVVLHISHRAGIPLQRTFQTREQPLQGRVRTYRIDAQR